MSEQLDYKTDQAAGLRRLMGKSEEAMRSEQTPAVNTTAMPEARPGKKTHIIAVTSGKGGVGKTCVAVNMALAMAKKGKKVLLFDADLGLANVNVMLGVIPKFNLYHVVKGNKRLSEIVISTPEGLDVIAGASGYSSLANLNEAQREKIISEFDKIRGYDIMIIDTGAGVGANVIAFTMPAHEVVVVTSPEPTSITDAYGVIKAIVLEAPDKNIRLLINRTSSSLEGRKVAERITHISNQFLNVKIDNIGFIYDDLHVAKAVRKQKPFYQLFPDSKASSCMNQVVARLLNNAPLPADDDSQHGLGSFFRRFFQVNAE